MAPSSTSSMPGCPAAVIETESPSQLIPSEIQRMWTSLAPELVCCSTAMGHSFDCHFLVSGKLDRVDQQLLAGLKLQIESAAAGTLQRECRHHRLRLTPAAAPARGHVFDDQLGSVEEAAARQQLERELERGRHNLAQMTNPQLDL